MENTTNNYVIDLFMENTTNNYIIDLFKWNDSTNTYEHKDDCIMSLDTCKGTLKIMSHTSVTASKEVYMLIDIVNDDFSIISRSRNNIASMYNVSSHLLDKTIDYEMRYKNHRFGVRFDIRSSASESNFYEKYDVLRSKHRFTEKYASGRIKLEGSKTNKGADGICIEYYDLKNSPIKYVGEFEDGMYDGEGEFYSNDGNIHLLCKNICSGKPNGKGFLRIGRNKDSKILEMKDFKDLSSNSCDYTNTIYSRLEPKYTEMMMLMQFEALTLNDKLMYLFSEIQELKKTSPNTTAQSRSFFNLF